MIFQRALRRELVSTAGAVFTTLFTIMITVMLSKILQQAAGGQVASEDVAALIGFEGIKVMPLLLVLTGFISVLLALTRSYQESEMVVWLASGLSLTRWLRPILSFGLPLVLLTATLSLFLTPWANQQSAEFRKRFEQREDIKRVAPGKFQESATLERIVYVEANPRDPSKVNNVFVHTIKDGKPSVVVAREGTTFVDEKGNKFLVMYKGRRYDGEPLQANFQMMEFEQYKVLVARQNPEVANDTTTAALPTMNLLADPSKTNLAELHWRISFPAMGLVLMILAVPLSFVNPRGGRSANMIVALLLAASYVSLCDVFMATISQGRLPFSLAVWPLHVAALVMAMFMFSWRMQMNSRYHPLHVLSLVKRLALGTRERT